jgi:hypothetical protein
MTYKLFNTSSSGTRVQDVAIVEITRSSSLSIISGNQCIFDTLRSTGGHTLSLNTGTGEITLDPFKHYYIQASIDITRGSVTSSFNFAWIDETGAVISNADGGFDQNWDFHSSTSSTNIPNATMTAMYVTRSPTAKIRLKAISVAAGSSFDGNLSVIIYEVTP